MTTDDPVVLLVDDSENDAKLMRIVFARAGFVQPLQHAVDGDEAIAYLKGSGRYRNRRQFPLPTIVLMDLNMPLKNGFEVLAWIRAQPEFKRLRVYVLSASRRIQDIEQSYDLGANSYLVKPSNLDGLLHLAQTLVAWLKVSHFAPVSSVDAEGAAAPAEGNDVLPVHPAHAE